MSDTSELLRTGCDAKLTATDLLIGVMEELQSRGPMRLVIVGFEETDEEEYIRFTNARSAAEEVGIIEICGKEARRLKETDDEEA